MSPVEVLLVFVGLPALIIVLCYLLAVWGTRGRTTARYKLGEKWDREPLWFIGKPRENVTAHRARTSRPAPDADAASPTVVGGASGTW